MNGIDKGVQRHDGQGSDLDSDPLPDGRGSERFGET
jgi:hypothetical protein